MTHTPYLLSLKPNEHGHDYFATDVHGCFFMLEKALRIAGFNPAVDRLFLGGDSVDRGPQSYLALDWLTRPYVFSVRGNHEQFCIDSAEFGVSVIHLENGGEWFAALDQGMRDEFASLFEGLPVAIELEGSAGKRIGVVHGECAYRDWSHFVQGLSDASNSFEQRHLAMEAMYRRTRHELKDCTPVTGIDQLFVGHSHANPPFALGNVMYMDSGAFHPQGALSLIDMNTLQIIQVKHEPICRIENDCAYT